MSPTPGRSTLMTSAPMKASSCVQVGPDCTCVKSRTRTPSSALPAPPHGAVAGDGSVCRPAATTRESLAFGDGFFACRCAVFFVCRLAVLLAEDVLVRAFLAFALPAAFLRVAITDLQTAYGAN